MILTNYSVIQRPFFALAVKTKTFQGAFWRLSTRRLVVPGNWTSRQWFINMGIHLYSSDRVLCRKYGTVFLLLCGAYVLHLTNAAIGAMSVCRVSHRFDSLSAAASVSNNFAAWASNDSTMTSLRSRSNITCLTKQYTTDRMRHCA